MENFEQKNQGGIFKAAIINGAIVAAVLIVITLAYYLLGQPAHKSQTWVSYIVFFGGLIYASIVYRDQYNGGFVSYGNSLLFNVLAGLSIGVITGLFSFIFLSFIAPDYLEEIRKEAIAEIERRVYDSGQNVGDSELEMMMDFALFFTRPWFMALASILNYGFFGLVGGLFISIFVKNNPPKEFMA